MRFNKGLKFLSITIATMMTFTSIAFGATAFKDVTDAHWAYTSISKIADRGLIVGDTQGYYKPNDYIDKFETSKILAKAAGYKYTNVSAEDKTYYDKVYDKNKTILLKYKNDFKKWNSTTDREIAYLLEKEIFVENDLFQFVIKASDGTEKVRALSREEASVFLVRLMNKKAEAQNAKFTESFKDNATITQASRSYIYYLKNLGIVSGDTEGNFNPNDAMTRAAMAVMLDKVLTITEGPAAAISSTGAPATAYSQANTAVSKVETITGVVDKYHSSLNALQIITNDGKKSIFKISANASIYVDSYLKTAMDLKEGMPIIAVSNNNEFVEIKAQAIAETKTPAASASAPVVSSSLEGFVSTLGAGTIGIEVRMLNTKGDIITEVRTFNLSEDCKITRGEKTILFSEIIKGDIIKAEISGSEVVSMKLEEKNKEITGGILLEKKYVETNNVITLVIQDASGMKHDLRVREDVTNLTRKDTGKVTWKDLRIGDTVNVFTEFEVIKELYASGTKAIVEGWVNEVIIGDATTGSRMVLKDANKNLKTYELLVASVDPYLIRVGSKVRLRLDSLEVETLVQLENAANEYFTGYVEAFKNNSFTIKDLLDGPAQRREVTYDSSTVVVNAKTGVRSNTTITTFSVNTKLYIQFASPTSSVAKTITVLSE